MSTIRGLVFHSRFHYVKQHLDYTTRRNINEHLSEQVRNVVSEQVFPVNFYRFEMLQELDNAIVTVTTAAEQPLFQSIGREFAHAIVDRYFFNYTEAQKPQRFLAQFQRLYARLWGFGQIDIRPESTRKSTIILEYPVSVHPAYHIFMTSFLTNAIALCGGKSVQLNPVESEDDPQECRKYVTTWQ
ncbi:MAG: TIGR02265 family protein [Calditrichaeota bacterium]|nr:TIGR02265 family protein [Calditrichota bacterium]MCB0299367.1 TIGR02265 family protein [Calditrichota bacterium]MCB9067793.1 TIGR02265 family protein [Calditrichia bacterium]